MSSGNSIIDLTDLSTAPKVLFAKVNIDDDTVTIEGYYSLSSIPSDLAHRVRAALGLHTTGEVRGLKGDPCYDRYCEYRN